MLCTRFCAEKLGKVWVFSRNSKIVHDFINTCTKTTVLKSDHLGVFCTLNIVKKPMRKVVSFRDQRLQCRQLFTRLLLCEKSFYDPDIFEFDINEGFNLLISLLQKCFDVSCPVRNVKLTDQDPPYMSPLLKYLCLKEKKVSQIKAECYRLREANKEPDPSKQFTNTEKQKL